MNISARITIQEIAKDLNLGTRAVVALIESKQIPAIRLGSRWLITRHVYEEWKRTCGTTSQSSTRKMTLAS